MCEHLPVAEITLHRGETGLGFNIRGGTDIPHYKEDSGIFVTKLKELGAAYRDRRIKEGDKILEVNGNDLRAVTHNEAVQIFITAGETVSMKVQHGAEAHILKQIESRKSGGVPMLLLVGLGVALVAGAGFFLMKNQK